MNFSAHQMNVDLKMEVQTRQNDVALLERQKDLMEKELKQAQVNSTPILLLYLIRLLLNNILE